MGRIRTVKPEFFKHSGLYDAENETGLPLRLAFAGLWTCCDREGRFKWRPRELKLDVLLYDECDFSRVLDALTTHGFVVRYVSGVEAFGYIPTWKRHQVINNKERESVLPVPLSSPQIDESITRGQRVEDASETLRKGKGMEGNVEGKGSASLPLDRPESSLMAIDPNMMARGLCERLNLSRSMGKGTVYEAVYDLALVEAAKGGDLAALCERMAAQQ